jgi:hypothetical protein
MALEQLANDSIDILDGDITNVATTLDVLSATPFSTAPQFRIKVGDEIMLVTGIATNTFTVTRAMEGTTATAHTDGNVVAQIVTAGGLTRVMKDWANPYFDDVDLPPLQILDKDSNTLTSSDFTWSNQRGTTVTEPDGWFVFDVDHDTDQRRMLIRDMPVGFSKLTMAAGIMSIDDPLPEVGILIYDSTDLDSVGLSLEGSSGVGSHRWASSTTRSSTIFTGGTGFQRGRLTWLQIEDDGVNFIFRFSHDGITWLDAKTESRTTTLANPDTIGIYLNNQGGTTNDATCVVYAYIEEANNG